MLKKLKEILNTYTEEELDEIDLWINSESEVKAILIDDNSIDLITSNASIKINDLETKETENLNWSNSTKSR